MYRDLSFVAARCSLVIASGELFPISLIPCSFTVVVQLFVVGRLPVPARRFVVWGVLRRFAV